MPYPDYANPDLLDRIPLSARVVLDVGCATGALGMAYKQRNPAARVLGIERDPDAARIAAQRLDRVAIADVERTPLPFGDEAVDCIVYGDVLEHLTDPWAVLSAHARVLSPNGTVVICMPNTEHWSFAARLLQGTWAYEDQGLFDRTHLRWFTYRSTQAALEGAGLRPFDVVPRIFDAPAAEDFTRAIEPALAALGVDPFKFLHRARPLQFVWRARRIETRLMQVTSTMLPRVGGVSDVRVLEPMKALASEPGFLTRVLGEYGGEALDLDTPRIFILHRPLLAGDEGLSHVRSVLAEGHIVVCEFDDHPSGIPVLQRPDIQNFRAVHAVQTSTEPLAAVLRAENPEVRVFRNAASVIPPARNFANPDRMTLFFGGLNRELDWPPYVAALNAVAGFVGERLHFQIVNDRGLFDALETPHKSFTPLCDYATYRDLLSRSEISFMPLADTMFNRCKSDLKFIEASAHRVAALASPVVYGDSVEDERTGFLFADPSQLQQRLARMVAQPDLTRDIAEAARAYVARERMMAYQVAERAAWYWSLWERREELTRALHARVPELSLPSLAVAGG